MAGNSLDTHLGIDTPEHLAFRVRLAGPARRFAAWILDLLLRGAIFIALSIALSTFAVALSLEGVSQGLLLIGLFALDWGYFVACELAMGGRSPGKMALKLRVVRIDGLPIGLRESVLRNLLRALDLLIFPPYLLPFGAVCMAFDPRFRRSGDWVAGTMVVVEDPGRLALDKTPAAQGGEDQEAVSIGILTREDREALDLFARRTQIGAARRAELAEMIAGPYAEAVGAPTPTNPVAFLTTLWRRTQGRDA